MINWGGGSEPVDVVVDCGRAKGKGGFFLSGLMITAGGITEPGKSTRFQLSSFPLSGVPRLDFRAEFSPGTHVIGQDG